MYKYYIHLKYMAYSNKNSLLDYKTELLKASDYFNENSIAAKNNKEMKIVEIKPDHIKIELISSNFLPMPSKALRIFSGYCTKFLTKTGKQIFKCTDTNENFNLLDTKMSNNKYESCNVSNQFLSFLQAKINNKNLDKKDKMINEILTKLYSLDEDQLITFYNFFNSFI